jgi:hypothetical protein
MRHCIGTIMAAPALIDKNTNQNGINLVTLLEGKAIKQTHRSNRTCG